MNAHWEKLIVGAKDHNQRRRFIRQSQGLCVGCGKPSDGKNRCEPCRAKRADESFRSYRARKGIPLDKPKLKTGRPIGS